MTPPMTTLTMESPPLARGRAMISLSVLSFSGITPACAGKRLAAIAHLDVRGNHPRLRGEEGDGRVLGCADGESPPLARGREDTADAGDFPIGITPACAGKRRRRCCPTVRPQNHPRLRGEEHVQRTAWITTTESPPLARGREDAARLRPAPAGITPACAGKSGKPVDGWKLFGNHPRLRGEEFGEPSWKKSGWESPPLARGRVAFLLPAFGAGGITPACAGKRPCLRYSRIP